MEIQTKEADGVSIVYISGRLTSSTAGQAYDDLVRIAQSGAPKVILNLRDLEYIASAGLRSILVAAKLINNARGEMRMCEANDNVRTILETSGFDNLVRLYSDEAEALKGF